MPITNDKRTLKETYRQIIAPIWAKTAYGQLCKDKGILKKELFSEYVEEYLRDTSRASADAHILLYGTSETAQMGIWLPKELDKKVVDFAEAHGCRINRVYGTALIKGLIRANKIKVHI